MIIKIEENRMWEVHDGYKSNIDILHADIIATDNGFESTQALVRKYRGRTIEVDASGKILQDIDEKISRLENVE